jgi:hypothetical protein
MDSEQWEVSGEKCAVRRERTCTGKREHVPVRCKCKMAIVRYYQM